MVRFYVCSHRIDSWPTSTGGFFRIKAKPQVRCSVSDGKQCPDLLWYLRCCLPVKESFLHEQNTCRSAKFSQGLTPSAVKTTDLHQDWTRSHVFKYYLLSQRGSVFFFRRKEISEVDVFSISVCSCKSTPLLPLNNSAVGPCKCKRNSQPWPGLNPP